ncbi:MAG: 50S ribosomal protein L35 [Deinococcus sp.]|nr:50S ribosomal protein L35 [Deinococcus sp.]
MPKLKTHKGARKRLGLTGRGKPRGTKAGKLHLNVKKSAKRVRQNTGTQILSKSERRLVRRLLPYD